MQLSTGARQKNKKFCLRAVFKVRQCESSWGDKNKTRKQEYSYLHTRTWKNVKKIKAKLNKYKH